MFLSVSLRGNLKFENEISLIQNVRSGKRKVCKCVSTYILTYT